MTLLMKWLMWELWTFLGRPDWRGYASNSLAGMAIGETKPLIPNPMSARSRMIQLPAGELATETTCEANEGMPSRGRDRRRSNGSHRADAASSERCVRRRRGEL